MTQPRHPVPRQIADSRRAEWRRLLAAQHNVVETGQLRAHTVSRQAIRSHIRGGRWQAVIPRVYATFTGPLPREAQVAAALLYAGPAVLLSHQTAAELWGMRRPEPGPVHVTVPYHCSAVSQPPVVTVHRSRAFQHIAVDGSPPVTSRADTVIDLAVAELSPREAQRTLSEFVTSKRVVVDQIARRLEERPPRRYRKALEEALDRLRTGVESVLEERYAVEVEVAHGLPGARRQAPFLVDGRTLFEDAVYDHIGVPLTVRLDGRTHLEPDVARRDRRRGNAAELAGRSRLVFGWDELERDACGAAREVASVLHRGGWHGPVRACPQCPGRRP
ncbi:hypothetical protein [Pseudonocardia spinosispora]|uniref:hypothetical protein n=1 Tax=Pseudonocardia spinosispora TaxID=103441 RepID=UPI0006886B46|nr:hypothetical protein [Pseudonocardia spinosispora]